MPSPRPRRRTARLPALLGAAVVLAATPACNRGCVTSPPPPPTAPRLATAADLTDAERRYGLAPRPDPSVTYRPDVIIVGGGAESVRAMQRGGMEWTIDADAQYARDLAPGKVMFLTGRAVGRVLAVQPRGRDLHVILGPIELTDVIEQGSFRVSQPVDFGEAIEFDAPDYPGIEGSSVASAWAVPEQLAFAGEGLVSPVAWQLQPTPAPYKPVPLRFASRPLVSATRLGVHLSTQPNAAGIVMTGEVSIHLKGAYLEFDLKIDGAKIRKAQVVIHGAAGLTMAFHAGSPGGHGVNLRKLRVQVPADFSIPIIGMSVPLAVTLRQEFIVTTAFGGKGVLNARGDWEFSGSFAVGYDQGKWGVGGPTGFSIRNSMLQSIEGASLAANGLDLNHSARIIVGIGAFGFATGPYVGMISSAGVTRFSDTALVVCRRLDLGVQVLAGVGYFIPQPVTNFLNGILRTFNLGEIKGRGGLETDPLPIIKSTSHSPNVPFCTGAGKS
jgi:hypothetical protein